MEQDQDNTPTSITKFRHTSHQRGAYNQLYVAYRRPTAVYLKHARKVIDKGIKVLVIHGMEASIPKAIDIALTIIDENPDVDRTITTDTIPTLVEEAGERKIREVSAIHITLKKKLPF